MTPLSPLNLPNAPLRLTRSGDNIYVVCLLRKKRIKLTPEEWVRQHIIYYLIQFKHYPSGLIQIERGINIHQLFRRCDLILNNRQGKTKIIVECKAPHIPISQLSFEQAAHYNQHLHAEYLVLTNGITHQIIHIQIEKQQIEFLNDIPDFDEIN